MEDILIYGNVFEKIIFLDYFYYYGSDLEVYLVFEKFNFEYVEKIYIKY